jgi:hypothetical protein
MVRNLIKHKDTRLHLDRLQTTSQTPLFTLHRPVFAMPTFTYVSRFVNMYSQQSRLAVTNTALVSSDKSQQPFPSSYQTYGYN